MDKYFINPIRFNTDQNLSFSFFRSFITFYYSLLFTNKLSNPLKYYKNIYKTDKYFELFNNEFIKSQNPLIFTYFNIIPTIFLPYFEELHYFFPIITFYGNDKFYKNGPIYFPSKKSGSYQYNHQFNKNEIHITIPINLIKSFQLPKNCYLLIKSKNKLLASNNTNIYQEHITLQNYKIKKYNKYKFTNHPINILIDEIEYLCILSPITKQGIIQSFKMNEIKKDSWLYYVYSENDYSQNFYTLYPKINMFNLGTTFDLEWKCVRNKLIKNLDVINLSVDIFYNNEITNRYFNDKFLDYKDENYNKAMKDDLFRCLNFDDELEKRIDICNFNMIENRGDKTWISNKGKKMIYLLIFKNPNIFYPDYIYYLNFLNKFNFKAFVYHYGYIMNNKKDFFDMEVGFTNKYYVEEYVKKIDRKKGDCSILYKKNYLK